MAIEPGPACGRALVWAGAEAAGAGAEKLGRIGKTSEGRLGDIPGFVPAMIVPEQPEKGTGTGCRRIEIVSANGRRVIVDCDVEVETLLRIMRGLETLP